ncbi:hypothetical protein [Haloarchaeobius salinus]|uniref:hypothetical protein n=1 Tax=Haloarchaeobius salinus TaxID=1198298 RepID=UPI00210E1070|nr:hypothetical protein [Haloarchaeobius salinus]
MIVVDTSALISVASVDLLESLLTEYDVHTTETVHEELEATAQYEDVHGIAAQTVLNKIDQIEIHAVETELTTSRIDSGEGTTAALTNELEADFLITDDLRALPELQTIVDARVAISPILLKAFVKRGVLNHDIAEKKLEDLVRRRSWLGAPIYRRAKRLFQNE